MSLTKSIAACVSKRYIQVSRSRQWLLIAAHIRSRHVHVVAAVDGALERAIGDMKAYASRLLRETGIDNLRTKRWARHGSTVRLSDRQAIHDAVRYVIEGQGAPMCWYLHPDW